MEIEWKHERLVLAPDAVVPELEYSQYLKTLLCYAFQSRLHLVEGASTGENVFDFFFWQTSLTW